MAIVIGDVHGCFNTFLELLKQLPINEDIYLAGDFIDRGPKSIEMIEFLINNPQIKSVIGNHEDMMIKYLNGHHKWWLGNGGRLVLEQYRKKYGKIPQAHIDFIQKLPYYIELDNLIISHSFCNSYFDTLDESINSRNEEFNLLWNRHGNPKKLNKYHIFGHTPHKKPIITKYYANIDTGCVYSQYRKRYERIRKLTALQYPSMNTYQQKNID